MFNKFFRRRKKDQISLTNEYDEFSFLMHQYDNLSNSHNSQNEMLWSAPAMFLTAQSFLLVIALGALSNVEWWARAIAAFISCVFGFISIQKFARDRLMIVSDAEQLLDIEKKMIKLGHPGMEIHDKLIKRKYMNNELLTKKLERKKIQNKFNSLSSIQFWEIGMWSTTSISFLIFVLTLLLSMDIFRNSSLTFDIRVIALVFLATLLSVIFMILDYTYNPKKLSFEKGTIFKILLLLSIVGTGIGVYHISISTDTTIKWGNTAISVSIMMFTNIIYLLFVRGLINKIKDFFKIKWDRLRKIEHKAIHIHTLILAGGDGKRLSEITKNKAPKFLAVKSGDYTLLENAVTRNKEVSEIHILAYKGYKEKINVLKKSKKSELNKTSINYEEYNKGTGTAIYNYIKDLKKNKKDQWEHTILIIAPSDHVIHDTHSYKDDIKCVCNLAKDFDYIYLVGIEPNYPAVDYGYFKINDNISYRITGVSNFIEKPTQIDAEKMIRAGNYYWNSGIFVAKAPVLEKEFEKYCADEIKEYKKEEEAYCKDAYLKSPLISFDKAILQKSNKLFAIIGSFDWIDIGDPIRLQGAIKEDICSLNERYFM